jgi:hypothetical protein
LSVDVTTVADDGNGLSERVKPIEPTGNAIDDELDDEAEDDDEAVETDEIEVDGTIMGCWDIIPVIACE